MADIELRYKSLLRRLFPRGWAWSFTDDQRLEQLVCALAKSPSRLEEQGFRLLDELDPTRTFELLERWEGVLGLPDDCTPTDVELSIVERRLRVLQKLTTGGGQNIAFFKLVASQLGYEVEEVDVKNFEPFRVGVARAGDELSNGTDYRNTVRFIIPTGQEICFRVGQSAAGDPLKSIRNDVLQCVLTKLAPAHAIVQFAFN